MMHLKDLLFKTTDKTLIQDKRLYVNPKINTTVIKLCRKQTYKERNRTVLVEKRMLQSCHC